MIGAGIFADDILVVDRSIQPMFGDIVVAEYDGGFTVKRLVRPARPGLRAVLHPENAKYQDLPIEESTELIIFGVVSAVVRCMRRNKKQTTSPA